MSTGSGGHSVEALSTLHRSPENEDKAHGHAQKMECQICRWQPLHIHQG